MKEGEYPCIEERRNLGGVFLTKVHGRKMKSLRWQHLSVATGDQSGDQSGGGLSLVVGEGSLPLLVREEIFLLPAGLCKLGKLVVHT